MKWINTIRETYASLSHWTQGMLLFCLSYLFCILLAIAGCYICAGRSIGYYTAMLLCRDLASALRSCTGITVLGTALLQWALKG